MLVDARSHWLTSRCPIQYWFGKEGEKPEVGRQYFYGMRNKPRPKLEPDLLLVSNGSTCTGVFHYLPYLVTVVVPTQYTSIAVRLRLAIFTLAHGTEPYEWCSTTSTRPKKSHRLGATTGRGGGEVIGGGEAIDQSSVEERGVPTVRNHD